MVWSQGLVELFKWRRQRRATARQASQLVAETERWLGQAAAVAQPPPEPPRSSEPPRTG